METMVEVVEMVGIPSDEIFFVTTEEIMETENFDEEDEAELTSLSWLQSLDITTASGLPTPPCSPSPPPMSRSPPKKLSPLIKAEIDWTKNAEKYLINPETKPPYSYATLICMAMRANNNKLTLSSIYAWIRENFVFYKHADPAWQNSIRHNLSLNKCFVKLPRTKNEPGKGGFWKLDLERLEEGKRSRRRATTVRRGRRPSKKSEKDDDKAGQGPKKAPYEEITPPSSVSPPIPDSLPEVPESNQVSLTEDDLTGLLIATVGWDENQLDLLDSLLDSL